MSALLDSARAAAELGALQGPQSDMLVSLLFNDGDSLPVIRPLAWNDPQAILVLTRSLRPQKLADVWAVRVHVAGGAAPVLTTERSTYCPPTPEPRGTDNLPVTVMVQVQPGDRMPARGRVRITVEVTVAKDGMPVRVRLVESSGIQELDEQFVHDFEARRFQPALLDGAPIGGVFRSDGYSPRR